MPKVHVPNIVQDLTDLSSSSNSLMQQRLVHCNLEDEWFSVFKEAAIKISEGRTKKDLSSADKLVPPILSFIQPKSDVKKKDALQEDESRAHIHGFKQNATVIIDKVSGDSEHLGIRKSAADVNKTPCLPKESHQQEAGLEADKVAIIGDGSTETVMTSIDNSTESKKKVSIKSSTESKKKVSIKSSTEASKRTSIDNDTEPNTESCMDDSTRIHPNSKLATNKQSSITIVNKVSTGECSKDVQENPSVKTPERKKSPIKDVITSQYENNYSQTPKTSKDSLKSCYVTQVIDKKFRSVCNSIAESIKISDKNPPSGGSSKRNANEGTSKQTREIVELNSTTKGTKVLKESNISRNAAIVSQKSAIIHNGSNISLLSSQRNIQPVIQPSLRNMVLKNTAQAIFMKKEEERIKELKMKEEKANENVQKSKTVRQMRVEENKRKRQEKMEQAELKRQKLEKEKELQLKKHYKPEVSSSTLKPTKNTEKRKYEDVEGTTETKHNAKREREDIMKKLENQKINMDTPSELCGTKAVKKIENRSNELTEKLPKQGHSAVNETFVMAKATPPSAPLKSKLNENNMKTPVNSSSREEITSYEMTPIQDNSDSEEESHKDRSKKIPAWASGMLLKTALYNQHHAARNPEEIFGSIIESPDLEKIFRKKRQHYNKRTSSRIWDSTIIEEDEKDRRASKRSKILEMRERLISCE